MPDRPAPSPDRFAIERELGHGGMATVYLARDLRLDRLVALKLIPARNDGGTTRDRFLRETRLTARLQHPHIVPVFDAGEDDGRLWYAMAYVEGETLAARIARGGPLPLGETLRIVREIGSALAAAHREGIIHRDLKPENVLLTRQGHAMVADFGIAKALSTQADVITETGMALGTPAYMAPEQITGSSTDARSDVYGLAGVAYAMLSGRPPHAGDSAPAVIAAALTASPPPIAELRRDVPAPVVAALQRALAKDPAARHQDIEDFLRSLEPGAPPGASPHRRRVLGGAIVALALLALAWVVGTRQAHPRSPASAASLDSLVVVLPPRVAARDSALQEASRELAILLASALDGLGDFRAVDPVSVLALSDHENATADEIARRTRAGRVVSGTLAREGGGLVVNLELRRPAGSVTRWSVRGGADSLPTLAERAATTLAAELWTGRAAPTASASALVNRPLAAVRPFLDGERYLVGGHFAQAAAAYQHAIDADSTFWAAYWRRAFAAGWEFMVSDTAARRIVEAHRDELPERDRALIEAGLRPTIPERTAAMRQVTERFPDWWLGHLLHADFLIHNGWRTGLTIADAEAAFARVVELNPSMTAAWDHLGWAAVYRGDQPTLAQVTAALERFADGDSALGPFTLRTLQYLLSLRNEDDSVATLVPTAIAAFSYEKRAWVHRFASAGVSGLALKPAACIQEATLLAEADLPTDLKVLWKRTPAICQAGRGEWDSALVAARAYSTLASDTDPAFAYGLAVLGAWIGVVDPAAAAQYRTPAAEALGRSTAPARAELAWFDGLLAAAAGDVGSLAHARRILSQSDDSTAPTLVRSLAAQQAWLEGRHREAAESLYALERERAVLPGVRTGMYQHPTVLFVNRLLVARELAVADPARARWASTVSDGALTDEGMVINQVLFRPLLDFHWARAEAAAGRRDESERLYRRFLRAYDRPPPAHVAMVTEARQALPR